MEVIGIAEKSGEYKGSNYHNIMIHCTKESDECFGLVSEVLKVKFGNVKEVFGKHMNSNDWQELLGKDVAVNYNRYGTVQSVIIRESD